MLWQLVGQTLALNQAAFRTIQNLPNGFVIALTVVFLASLSEAIGQSIVLLANRVKPKRFVLSLLFVSRYSGVWIVVLDAQHLAGGHTVFCC